MLQTLFRVICFCLSIVSAKLLFLICCCNFWRPIWTFILLHYISQFKPKVGFQILFNLWALSSHIINHLTLKTDVNVLPNHPKHLFRKNEMQLQGQSSTSSIHFCRSNQANCAQFLMLETCAPSTCFSVELRLFFVRWINRVCLKKINSETTLGDFPAKNKLKQPVNSIFQGYLLPVIQFSKERNFKEQSDFFSLKSSE